MTDHSHHQITIVIATLATLTGCNIQFGWGDPCEQDELGNFTNPAFNGLSTAEQDACKECGQIECAEETETGDGDPGDAELYCRDDAAGYSAPFCWPAELAPGMPMTNPVVVDVDDCISNSWPFPHVPDFSTAIIGYSGPMSQWCARAGEGFDGLHPVTGPEWRVCTNAGGLSSSYDGGDQTYYPAAVVNEFITNPDQPGWSARMDCQHPTDLSAICDLGLVAVGGQDPSRPREWTCACESGDDADCQLGAVCQAGWTIVGMHPQPTLCTWAGNNNVGGPAVYGLGNWGDGVTVNGNAITMTPAMIVAAIGTRAALFNDSQSLEGELGSWAITRCEDDSLCAQLGLGVGDEVEFDIDDAGELLEGVTKVITVFRDGSDVPETWSLTISE